MELCLVVAEKKIENVLSTMDQYGSFAHSFEIRADYLEHAAYGRLRDIREKTGKKLIFTVRKREDGGCWDGSEKLRRQLYEGAVEAGFDYIDLEIGALPEIRGNDKTTIIRSHHDMRHVPSDILERYVIAQTDPAEIPKISVMLKSSTDVIRFLRWNQLIQRMGPRKKIITAMGRKGVFSRILGEKLGTMHTYAPVPGTTMLPGMLDIHQLVDRYRVHEIDGNTRVHGLLDKYSSFVPPGAPELHRFTLRLKNTVRVPFILDSSEEMLSLRDFFDIQRFYRTFG